MAKRLNKAIAIIAVITVMAISALTTTVNAVTPDEPAMNTGNNSYWTYNVDAIYNRYPVGDMTYYGKVTGLVSGSDTGITFHRQTFNNGGKTFYVMGEISDPRLRLYPNTGGGANLGEGYNDNHPPTDLFVANWYELNNYSSDVYYVIYATDYQVGYNQYVTGYCN